MLVVEDHPINLMLTLKLLERWGHRAGTAENGEVALRRIGVEAPGLVLLDLKMPVLDGGQMLFATIGRLRGRPLPVRCGDR